MSNIQVYGNLVYGLLWIMNYGFYLHVKLVGTIIINCLWMTYYSAAYECENKWKMWKQITGDLYVNEWC